MNQPKPSCPPLLFPSSRRRLAGMLISVSLLGGLAIGALLQASPVATASPVAAASPCYFVAPWPACSSITTWQPSTSPASQSSFVPLQLLACRSSQESVYLSQLVHAADGQHLVTAGTKVLLWSIDDASPTHVFAELPDGQMIKSLAIAPHGEWFAAGDSEGNVSIWNLADRSQRITKQLDNDDIIHIAVSPNSQSLATISYDNEVSIWSTQGLEQTGKIQTGTNNVKCVEFLSDDLLVVAGENTTIWNVSTGKQQSVLSPGRYNFTLARSPDGSQFVFGTEEQLKLLNTSDQNLVATFAGGFASEELAAFSSDGLHLATANGAEVRIWSCHDGQLLQLMDTYGSPIVGIGWLPQSNLLAIASENGRIRIWGSPENGNAYNLQPLTVTSTMPEADSQQPASSAQLLQILDLRTFPHVPECSVQAIDEFSFLGATRQSPADAKAYYKNVFEKAGWQEDASAPNPSSSKFHKDGFWMTASFYPGMPSQTSVNLNFAGNCDLRTVPKFDASATEIAFENEDIVMYRTKADVLEIETSLLKKLQAGGWIPFSRLHASHSEKEDSRDLEFLNGSVMLNVSIDRFPADRSQFMIRYTRSLTPHSIPVPSDAGFIEYDGSTRPYLVATTRLDLPQTREFFDAQLARDGWLAHDVDRVVKDDQNWLSYFRGQQDLTVKLKRLPDDKTLIQIGDDLEKSSWQLAKPQSTEPENRDQPAIGIEAADFPLLNASQTAKFDELEKQIEFSMEDMPLPKVADLYLEKIKSLGWRQDGFGIKEDDFVLLRFEQDGKEIALRARVLDGQSLVSVEGDGILWTKPTSTSRRIISYEAWLRANHHPGTLDLLEQYQQEMK